MPFLYLLFGVKTILDCSVSVEELVLNLFMPILTPIRNAFRSVSLYFTQTYSFDQSLIEIHNHRKRSYGMGLHVWVLFEDFIVGPY